MSMKDRLPKGCPFKIPASVKPMHDVTRSNVIDQARTDTSLGQGTGSGIVNDEAGGGEDNADDDDVKIDDSFDSRAKLEQDVCCTFQTNGDNFDVDHVDDLGRAMDDVGPVVDAIDLGVGVKADVDVDVDVDAGDSSTLVADGRDGETRGKDCNEGDDDGDRSLCCRCIVFNAPLVSSLHGFSVHRLFRTVLNGFDFLFFLFCFAFLVS